MEALLHKPHIRADQETYWRAVQKRDEAYDGRFVYAVRSTGIYCRPICPSRRPNRSQVQFFPEPEAAEHAGFRACLRCRPGDDSPDPQLETVRRACRSIETNLDGQWTLAALGREVGMSPHHLQRVFKRIAGITPRQYADACRMDQFKARLRKGDDVTTAMYDAGYGSSSRLYERAPSQLGMTPTTYRRGGRGMQIHYTIADCQLGRVLVAMTERGICFLSFSDSDIELERALRREYPDAATRHDDEGFSEGIGPVIDHLAGHRPHLDLPVDVQATAFQWRVWQELQAIPIGATRTYKEIAYAVGKPTAARAVARACATNPVPLVIPCHRVVRGDGGLGGYRWGLERKRALLDRERIEAEGTNLVGEQEDIA